MDSETDMQRSIPILILCIHCCPLAEEEGCHLFVALFSR
jgi:hypothetical protein